MKNTIALLQIIILIILAACSSSNKEMSERLLEVKNKWAGDSRVAIFDVKVKIASGVATVIGETTLNEAKQEFLLSIQEYGYGVVDSLVVLPVAECKQKWAVTTLSVANLRDAPSHGAQLVSQTIMGTPVKVLKQGGDWSLIQSPDHYIAWTNNSSLQFMDDIEFNYWQTSPRVFITEDCWLMDDANQRITDLVKGSLLVLSGQENGMATLVLPDGRVGLLSDTNFRDFYAVVDAPAIDAKQLTEVAHAFMGLPYLWGGTSSKAVDCSGFLKNIYFMNGYILDRDASQQIEHGCSIELNIDSLMAGDLLFFGNKASNRVTHVAMYIGDTEYIHSSGRVKINSLDSTRDNYSNYRTSTWLGAQRYIGQEPGEGIMAVKRHPWYVVIN
jgi:hypothetical protein